MINGMTPDDCEQDNARPPACGMELDDAPMHIQVPDDDDLEQQDAVSVDSRCHSQISEFAITDSEEEMDLDNS